MAELKFFFWYLNSRIYRVSGIRTDTAYLPCWFCWFLIWVAQWLWQSNWHMFFDISGLLDPLCFLFLLCLFLSWHTLSLLTLLLVQDFLLWYHVEFWGFMRKIEKKENELEFHCIDCFLCYVILLHILLYLYTFSTLHYLNLTVTCYSTATVTVIFSTALDKKSN